MFSMKCDVCEVEKSVSATELWQAGGCLKCKCGKNMVIESKSNCGTVIHTVDGRIGVKCSKMPNVLRSYLVGTVGFLVPHNTALSVDSWMGLVLQHTRSEKALAVVQEVELFTGKLEVRLSYNREGEIELVKDWHEVSVWTARYYYNSCYSVHYRLNGVEYSPRCTCHAILKGKLPFWYESA